MLMPSLFYDNFDLFDDMFRTPWFGNHDFKDVEKKLYGHNGKNLMSTDIKETDTNYEMIIDLPGFKKEEITVEFENGYLTISAAKGLEKEENSDESEKKECHFIRKERYSGELRRSFYIGENLEKDEIKAAFEHGILKLNIPKADMKKIENNKYIAIEG